MIALYEAWRKLGGSTVKPGTVRSISCWYQSSQFYWCPPGTTSRWLTSCGTPRDVLSSYHSSLDPLTGSVRGLTRINKSILPSWIIDSGSESRNLYPTWYMGVLMPCPIPKRRTERLTIYIPLDKNEYPSVNIPPSPCQAAGLCYITNNKGHLR